MKKVMFFIPLLITSIGLTGCSLFNDDSWKKEYGTPELFLENIKEGLLYLYDNQNQTTDTDDEIKTTLSLSGPYEETKTKKPTSEKYFTYQAYWQPATSGPNYCNMSVWDDGFIKIHHKNSLGPHQYTYFTMDAEKATIVVNMVFLKLAE